jgi:hypothetical protein
MATGSLPPTESRVPAADTIAALVFALEDRWSWIYIIPITHLEELIPSSKNWAVGIDVDPGFPCNKITCDGLKIMFVD